MDATTHASLIADVRVFLANAIQKHGAVAQKDLAAWERFFDVYNDILVRFASKLKFHTQEQEDLTQDVWCRVIQDLPRYQYDPARGGFRRWLYTIVQCRAIDHARHRRVRASTTKRPLESRSILQGNDPSYQNQPADELDRQFKTEVVRAAIDIFKSRASEKEWEVFNLCRMQGKAPLEVAEQLELNPATVRKRLERAMEKLREAIVDLVGTADDLFP
ncbi:MAG: sigma-70 family RNA polymerase sigma factor [Planctomycetota bacterium]